MNHEHAICTKHASFGRLTLPEFGAHWRARGVSHEPPTGTRGTSGTNKDSRDVQTCADAESARADGVRAVRARTSRSTPCTLYIPAGSHYQPSTMASRAVIFDLDGLLADTEVLHCQAYLTALAEFGVTLTNADYEEHWIRRGAGIVELCSERGLPIDPLAARARKLELYQELVRKSARAMNGAHELVERLRSAFPLAVGTSSMRTSAQLVLTSLGFDFPVIVTADDVARIKPGPDIFLEAARRLGVEPRDCVVLEDAEKGIIAAHAAGMKSIAVPNRHTHTHDFSAATRVVSSLLELTTDDFARVFEHAPSA